MSASPKPARSGSAADDSPESAKQHHERRKKSRTGRSISRDSFFALECGEDRRFGTFFRKERESDDARRTRKPQADKERKPKRRSSPHSKAQGRQGKKAKAAILPALQRSGPGLARAHV